MENINIYDRCPKFENEKYKLRYVSIKDCLDLLEVYSDTKSVPFFNSDNCGGDDFYYTTEERMQEAIEYWHFEYERKGFVRWSIIDKHVDKVIGTIELFQRNEKDYFNQCGLLRLDLLSTYENTNEIENILSLIIDPTFELFDCQMIATKAIDGAKERIHALEHLNFKSTNEKLIGHDGTEYMPYFVLNK